jgi:hypothetical protein
MQSARFERNGGRGRGNGARNHNDDDEGGIPEFHSFSGPLI